MNAVEKLATVTVQVPYRGAGNVIRQKDVAFDVYKDTALYKAVPLLSADEIRLANLPPELTFERVDGSVVSTRGIKDGNLHVIKNIVTALEGSNIPV